MQNERQQLQQDPNLWITFTEINKTTCFIKHKLVQTLINIKKQPNKTTSSEHHVTSLLSLIMQHSSSLAIKWPVCFNEPVSPTTKWVNKERKLRPKKLIFCVYYNEYNEQWEEQLPQTFVMTAVLSVITRWVEVEQDCYRAHPSAVECIIMTNI